jgi:hypothetical protein
VSEQAIIANPPAGISTSILPRLRERIVSLFTSKAQTERIKQLLAENKALELELTRLRKETGEAESEIERLRNELIIHGQAEFALEVFEAERDRQTAEVRQRAEDRLTQLLGVIIGCSRKAVFQGQHPDCEEKVRRACLPVHVLEAVCCHSEQIIPELVYTITSHEAAAKRLAALGPAPVAFMLEKVVSAIEQRIKFENLTR